jgi:hypothetical protein
LGRPGPRGPRVWYLFPLAISKTGSKPEVGEEEVRTSVARASGLSAASEPVSDGAVEEAVARAAGMFGGVEGARIEDRNVPIEGGDIEG